MSMRVLHVAESLKPDPGSVAVSLSGLFRALQARAIESSHLVAEDEGTSANGDVVSRAVSRADLVHIHGFGYGLAGAAATAANAASTPYVISPLGALGQSVAGPRRVRDRLSDLFSAKRVIPGARAIGAVNDVERAELESVARNGKVVSLPYGIDVARYRSGTPLSAELPDLPPGPCLLILAPIHPEQGFVPLLRAFAEIGATVNPWHIVIAGRVVGDWRDELEAAIRRKGGEKRVTFTAAPDVATQQAWLARASLLVSPSLRIGCGVAVMQAVAGGTPVLATRPSVPGVLSDIIGGCGPSRHEIKRALRKLIDQTEEERQAAGRRVRDTAGDCLDWSV
ncbi:MAG: glycosyltransferase family 4 protein, partial [Phycisphaerae bacterium]